MATGLIVEYNPMHRGHILHAEAARVSEHDTVIAAMSGWFVQRGEPAITDPYTRAQIAVQNGVDLVLLLPVIHSIQSATYFAQGAVDLLLAAGVDRIVYGSENPAYVPAPQIDEYSLKEALSRGHSYASALQKNSLGAYLDANTRLGLCYREAIQHRDATIPAVPILREPWPDTSVPKAAQNATAVRNRLLAGSEAAGLAAPVAPPYHSLEDYFVILTHLVRFPREDPSLFPYFEPGLDDRLKNTREGAQSVADWVARARSKRHTMARIRRFLLHLLLGLTKEKLTALTRFPPDALVPLALNDKGRAHLRTLKDRIPILSTRKALHKYCAKTHTPYQWDLLAERMYNS